MTRNNVVAQLITAPSFHANTGVECDYAGRPVEVGA